MSNPLVYLVLGSRGAGRLAVLSDLIEFGTERDAVSQIMVSADDWEGDELNFSVASHSVKFSLYPWGGGELELPPLDRACQSAFVVADGVADPADYVDSFFRWLQRSGAELARVLTVMDCSLVERVPKAQAWYDCCVHFSDVVLLSNREGVSNRWIKDLQDRYRKQRFPCLFELVKRGRVKNPALILDPSARRITMLFDESEEAYGSSGSEYEVIDEEGEEEDLDEEEAEERAIGNPEADPYLRRLPGGRREKVLPDMKRMLAEGQGAG